MQSIDPRISDEMLVWGARAAADLAGHARDRRDPEGVRVACELLDRLTTQRDGLAGVPFAPLVPDDRALPALGAVFAAEAARCTGGPTPADRWAEVAAACDGADFEASGRRVHNGAHDVPRAP